MPTFPCNPPRTTTPATCHCAHVHRPGRDAILTFAVALCIAVILLLCGVALFGVHICGDEVGAAMSMWRGSWGSWAPVWSWQWVSSTYTGGQS